MAKKRNVLLLASALSFSAITIGTLASCNDGQAAKEIITPYNVTVQNDNSLGSYLLFDDKGAVTKIVNSNTFGVLKVNVTNTDYEVDTVKSGDRIFEYDDEKEGYLIDKLTSDTNIVISYKKIFSTLKVNLDIPEIESYKVFADSVELTNNTSYIVGVGKTVGIKFALKKNVVFEKLYANKEEIQFNTIAEEYQFVMPKDNVDVTIDLYKTAPVNYNFSDNLNPTFKVNDEVCDMPQNLKVGSKLVIESSLPEGFAYDNGRSSIANETTGNILDEDQAKVEVIENKIIVTIGEIQDFEYSITILTRKIGKYDGENFLGSWSSPKGSDIANFNPIISFSGDEKTGLSFVNGNVAASGTYSKNADGTIVAKYKNAQKNIRGIFRPVIFEDKVIAIYGETYDGYSDQLLLFPDGRVTASFEKIKFNNDKTKCLIRIEYNKTNEVKWIYSTQYNLLETNVTNLTNEPVSELVDKSIYKVDIKGKKTEIKFNKGQLTIAGIEQGTYTKEGSPDLVIDGYGSASIGEILYTYTYNENTSVLILTKEEVETKLEINLYDLTYNDYIPKTNMLTGLSYHFTADDRDENNRSYQDVDFRFKDSNYIIVNAGLQCTNGETSYTLTDDRKFSAVLPFVSGPKLIEGYFDKTFTKIEFYTTKLIFEGDMIGVVGKLTAIEGDFKAKDTTSNDILHLKADMTYSINEGPSQEYFIDISSSGILVKGSQNYRLNLEKRTFESTARKPGNWFIWNSFSGNLKITDREPPILLSASITFDSSTNDTIKHIKIIQRTIGWNEGDNIYEVTNVKYTYDSAKKLITITDGTNSLQLLNDERHNQLIFHNSAELNGKLYYLSTMRITAL